MGITLGVITLMIILKRMITKKQYNEANNIVVRYEIQEKEKNKRRSLVLKILKHYNVSIDALKFKYHDKELREARSVVSWFLLRHTSCQIKDIEDTVKRGASSIYSSVNKINNQLEQNKEFREKIESITGLNLSKYKRVRKIKFR